MTCYTCKHPNVSEGKVTIVFERGDATIIFKEVPALVCANCGEEYVSSEITQRLLSQAKEMEKAGVQVEIRKYVA